MGRSKLDPRDDRGNTAAIRGRALGPAPPWPGPDFTLTRPRTRASSISEEGSRATRRSSSVPVKGYRRTGPAGFVWVLLRRLAAFFLANAAQLALLTLAMTQSSCRTWGVHSKLRGEPAGSNGSHSLQRGRGFQPPLAAITRCGSRSRWRGKAAGEITPRLSGESKVLKRGCSPYWGIQGCPRIFFPKPRRHPEQNGAKPEGPRFRAAGCSARLMNPTAFVRVVRTRASQKAHGSTSIRFCFVAAPDRPGGTLREPPGTTRSRPTCGSGQGRPTVRRNLGIREKRRATNSRKPPFTRAKNRSAPLEGPRAVLRTSMRGPEWSSARRGKNVGALRRRRRRGGVRGSALRMAGRKAQRAVAGGAGAKGPVQAGPRTGGSELAACYNVSALWVVETNGGRSAAFAVATKILAKKNNRAPRRNATMAANEERGKPRATADGV